MHRDVSIFSNASFILSFVDLMPFCYLFMCPISVAGHETGRYFWTASAVRPGHVANWLFFIALRSFYLGGQNRHWWRYLMSSSLDIIWYSLLAMWLYVLLVLGWVIFPTCLIGSTHNPVKHSLVPVHTTFPL